MASESVRLDEVPAPLVVIASGTVQDVSPSAMALLGQARPDLVGASLTDLVAPEYRGALEEFLGAAVLGGRVRASWWSAWLVPGPRPVGVIARGGADGRILVGLRDLAAEQRLSAVIDAVADSTLLLDPDGRLLWQSAALAARVPGGSANLGTHPVERLHPEDLPMVLEAFSDLNRLPGGRMSRVVRSRAVDNDDLWQLIELVGSSRVDHPDLGGVVVSGPQPRRRRRAGVGGPDRRSHAVAGRGRPDRHPADEPHRAGDVRQPDRARAARVRRGRGHHRLAGPVRRRLPGRSGRPGVGGPGGRGGLDGDGPLRAARRPPGLDAGAHRLASRRPTPTGGRDRGPRGRHRRGRGPRRVRAAPADARRHLGLRGHLPSRQARSCTPTPPWTSCSRTTAGREARAPGRPAGGPRGLHRTGSGRGGHLRHLAR